jgi:hypothetical protein
MDRRAIFCEWFESQRIRADDMFSDETCFHLKGYVKRHNTVYWVQDCPHVAVDTRHRTNPWITAWCATPLFRGQYSWKNAKHISGCWIMCSNRRWMKCHSQYAVGFCCKIGRSINVLRLQCVKHVGLSFSRAMDWARGTGRMATMIPGPDALQFFPPRVIWSNLVTTPTNLQLTELTENTRAAITDTTHHILGQDWPTSPHKQTA